jgi:hypothetical protein
MPTSFSHTFSVITLEEAPESTIQLWRFLLKILKVNKKGGVVNLDLWPVKDALKIDCVLGAVFLSS